MKKSHHRTEEVSSRKLESLKEKSNHLKVLLRINELKIQMTELELNELKIYKALP